MIGWTFCSGIGAPEVAAPEIDWRLASEIADFPREVLQYRLGYKTPDDHNQGDPLLCGDFTKITPETARRAGVPLPDILVAGTPCQAFSIAGLRKGVEDDRGNLTLQFVRIVHAIQSARPDGRLCVVWENVPGVLSDEGNAFGAFLGGMVGAMDALPSPDGGSWASEGMVEGPRSRAAWAVLDAQWFGVAQRRRRVFVVFDFGGCVDPAAVLFDADRLRGDSPPRREAGQGVAAGTLRGTTGGSDVDHGTANHLISARMTAIGEYADDETASTIKARDYKDATDLVAHTLRGSGFDASEDGTGRRTPIVSIAFNSREDPEVTGDRTGPLTASSPQAQAVAFVQNQRDEIREIEVAGALAAQPGMKQQTFLAQPPAPVAFDLRGRDGGAMPEGPHDTAAIRAASGGSSRSYIAQPWAVRRLTPRECDRLQGFPDDWTLIPRSRKRALKDIDGELAYLRQTYPEITEAEALMLAADGPRYQGDGNSMAVPVMRWILTRAQRSWAQLKGAA